MAKRVQTTAGGEPAEPLVAQWKAEIDLYERSMDKWLRSSRKLLKRYKDVRVPAEESITRVNVLWSNVQTRLPALYARDPKPEVERRFKDRDPIGRMVGEVIERTLDFTVQHVNAFGEVMRQVVLDYELPGRGTVWVRYVPKFAPRESLATEGGQGLRDSDGEDADSREMPSPQPADNIEQTTAEDDTGEELHDEETIVDYVSWEDFGHTWARIWAEVRGVWRRVYLDRTELTERFGGKGGLSAEQIKAIPLDWAPKNIKETAVKTEQKKAVVYEIWDKRHRKAIWIAKSYPRVLDEREDPLELEHFFPCPRPLYANLASDELIPTPNFRYYQDQAREIDELATRIVSIGKALKVAGIRDSSAPGLDRLLAEGTENQLVPVDGWVALKEKGGLKGVIELLPLDMIAEALGYLREQMKQLIDQVYEITGLSDIIRGLSDPNETATAQQIKGQFAVLRISDAQTEVQRFCRDIMRILAEVICDYDLETLKKISGVKLLTNQEKAEVSAQLQMAAAQGGPPPNGGAPAGPGLPAPAPHPGMPQMPGAAGMPVPVGAGAQGAAPSQPGQPAGDAAVRGAPAPGAQPPGGVGGGVRPPGASPQVDPERVRLLKEPSWEDVAGLLKNPVLREFRIDIETDSTIRTDEEADRQARMAFLEAVAKMIQEASTVPKPMIPAAGELILFAIRGFKVARNLERVFEEAIDQLKDAPPTPDPEQMKAQLEAQTQMQIEQMKGQVQMQIAQAQQQAQAQEDAVRNQVETQRSQAETAMKSQHEQALQQMKDNFESQRVQFEAHSKEKIADADNQTKLLIAHLQGQHEAQMKQAEQTHETHMTGLQQQHEASMGAQKIGHEQAMGQHKAGHEKDLAVHKTQHEATLADKQAEHEKGMAGVQAVHGAVLEDQKAGHAQGLEHVKAEHAQGLEKIKAAKASPGA